MANSNRAPSPTKSMPALPMPGGEILIPPEAPASAEAEGILPQRHLRPTRRWLLLGLAVLLVAVTIVAFVVWRF